MDLVRRTPLRAAIGGLAGLLAAVAFATGPLAHLEDLSADLRLHARPVRPPAAAVVVVGISDTDLAALGSWPLPRAVHADILRILAALEPRQIVVDILFADPSKEPEQDAALAEAIREAGRVTLAYHFDQLASRPGGNARPHFLEGHHHGLDVATSRMLVGLDPVPPFATLACRFGAANGLPDPADGVVRSAPLFLAHAGRLYPSLAMQAVLAALAAQPDQIRVEPGRHVELTGTGRGTVRIPIDARGLYRVNYSAGLGDFTGVDYTSLYRAARDPDHGRKLKDAIKDKVVLVGYVASGGFDTAATPLGPMPGLIVHATLVSNLLGGAHLRATPFWLDLVLCGAAGIVAGLAMRFRTSRNLLVLAALSLVWIAGTFFAIRFDLLLPLVAPLAAFHLCCATVRIHSTRTADPAPAPPAAPVPRVDAQSATVALPAADAATKELRP